MSGLFFAIWRGRLDKCTWETPSHPSPFGTGNIFAQSQFSFPDGLFLERRKQIPYKSKARTSSWFHPLGFIHPYPSQLPDCVQPPCSDAGALARKSRLLRYIARSPSSSFSHPFLVGRVPLRTSKRKKVGTQKIEPLKSGGPRQRDPTLPPPLPIFRSQAAPKPLRGQHMECHDSPHGWQERGQDGEAMWLLSKPFWDPILGVVNPPPILEPVFGGWIESDVHWGYGLAFEPWPCSNPRPPSTGHKESNFWDKCF